jgi:hypothetical protein
VYPWTINSDINGVVGQRAIATMIGVDRCRHVVNVLVATLAANAAAGAAFLTTFRLTFGNRVVMNYHMGVPSTAGATSPPLLLSDLNLIAEPGESVTVEIVDNTIAAVAHQSVFASGFTEPHDTHAYLTVNRFTSNERE